MTVDDPLTEIKVQYEEFDSVTVEVNFFQARIDPVFEELNQIRERSVELINENGRLLYANAQALNESASNDDEDQIMAEAKDLFLKSQSEGLYDEDKPSLESILGRLKYIVELKQQLRLALIDLLDETRKLKDRSKPK